MLGRGERGSRGASASLRGFLALRAPRQGIGGGSPFRGRVRGRSEGIRVGRPPFPEGIVNVVRGLHPLAVLPPRDHEREANLGAHLVKWKTEKPGMQGGPAERAPLTLNLFDLLLIQ